MIESTGDAAAPPGVPTLKEQRVMSHTERVLNADTVEVRADAWGGLGLFAKREIGCDELYLRYFGRIMTHAQLSRRYPDGDHRYALIYSGGSMFIDAASVMCLAGRANHAAHNPKNGDRQGANAVIHRYDPDRDYFPYLTNVKPLRPGDQIFVDYGEQYFVGSNREFSRK